MSDDGFFGGVEQALERLRTDTTDDPVVQLLELSRELSSVLDTRQLLVAVGEAVMRVGQGDRFVVLLGDGTGELNPTAARDDRRVDLPLPPQLCEPLCQRALATGKVVFVPQPQRTPPYSQVPVVRELGLVGMMAVPLVSPKGLVGVVYTDGASRFASQLAEKAQQILLLIGAHAAIALENAGTLERVAIEPATKLHTAAYFERRVLEEQRRAGRYGRSFAVALIEVVGADDLHLRHGADALDTYVREIGRVIHHTARRADVIARHGPARLAVLLLETTDANGPRQFADRLQARLREEPLRLGALVEPPRVCVGGVTCRSAGTAATLALMHEAELALESAKDSGLDQFLVR